MRPTRAGVANGANSGAAARAAPPATPRSSRRAGDAPAGHPPCAALISNSWPALRPSAEEASRRRASADPVCAGLSVSCHRRRGRRGGARDLRRERLRRRVVQRQRQRRSGRRRAPAASRGVPPPSARRASRAHAGPVAAAPPPRAPDSRLEHVRRTQQGAVPARRVGSKGGPLSEEHALHVDSVDGGGDHVGRSDRERRAHAPTVPTRISGLRAAV